MLTKKRPMTTMSIRGVTLFVRVIGRGYPLLLMHGGPGMDHSSMLPLQPCADRFTLIFYDHRCNGRSDCEDVRSMTWDNLTADAEALRQELGFDKWAILGHSFGGMVALEYALRFPQNLSHLILMDTCGDSRWVHQNAPELLESRGFSARAVAGARRFFNGQLTPEEVFPTASRFARAYNYQARLLPLIRQAIFGPHPKMRPEAQIFGFGQLFPGWTVMERLGEITIPTLVLAGRDDFQFPPEHQAILADRLPNAHLKIIERAGHNVQMERPAEVVEAITQFLNEVRPDSS